MWGLVGFRAADYLSSFESPCRDNLLIRIKRHVDPEPERRIEMTGLLPLHGSVQPHVDRGDQDTRIAGFQVRIGPSMPKIQMEDFLSRFRKFVGKFLRERRVPRLAPDTDLSVETWLENSNYPLWRKNELLKINEEYLDVFERKKPKSILDICVHGNKIERLTRFAHFDVSSFIKDESYAEYKHARWINARSDMAKVAFGPVVQKIEKIVTDIEVFPEFVKHVPTRDRATYVMDRLYVPGHTYVATDYSSFESHFSAALMSSCEFVLYEYMTADCPQASEVITAFKEVCLGMNFLSTKTESAMVEATRMSGEMSTSLGNGFTNLCLMAFLCDSMGVAPLGVVEGDDGLFSFPPGSAPKTEDFVSMGCKIKLQQIPMIGEASFCGLVFDETDRTVLVDPVDVMVSTGWAPNRYHACRKSKRDALLRAKALSLLYQYPACPIVSEYARYLLRRTRSLDVRHVIEEKGISLWERDQLRAASRAGKFWNVVEEIGEGSRLLVQKVFGILIADQYAIEQRLREYDDRATFLSIPELETYIPEVQKDCWDKYVVYGPARLSVSFGHMMNRHLNMKDRIICLRTRIESDVIK